MQLHDRPGGGPRRWRYTLPLLALLAVTAHAAPPSPADTYAGPAGQPGDGPGWQQGGFRGDDGAPATPLPWRQLNPEQRAFLKPLQSQWDRLPPRRQQRMAAQVQQWTQMPPQRQAEIQQRMTRWAQMTPQQRMEAARNAHAFQNMSPQDRQRVAEVFHRFQSLTPEQKQALREKFRAMRQARQNGMAPGASPPRPR